MGTAKLIEKLEHFFDLSEKKQNRKQHKLLKIIDKLEAKQSRLQHEIERERDSGSNSEHYQELKKELAVISGLINKAEQKQISD